jgi:hypothetical protein
VTAERSAGRAWWSLSADLLTIVVGAVALIMAARAFVSRERPQASLNIADVESTLRQQSFDTLTLIRDGERDPALVRFSGSRHVFFLFRTDCRACKVTEPIWMALLSEIDPSIEVEAITPQPPNDSARFLRHHRVRVWHAPSADAFRRAFLTPVVPVTVVTSERGSVHYARVGALVSSDLDSLRLMLRR